MKHGNRQRKLLWGRKNKAEFQKKAKIRDGARGTFEVPNAFLVIVPINFLH